MATTWKSGGKTLTQNEIPYQPGTPEYYRYVAAWKAKAKGEEYQKSERLRDLEARMELEKIGVEGAAGVSAEEREEYKREQAAYVEGRRQWERDIADLARQEDRGQAGRAARGYAQRVNPVTGQKEWFYAGPDVDDGDLNPDGTMNTSNDYAALLGTAEGIVQKQALLGGAGKFGGAGNANPAGPVDNSWNDLDGVDVRTDEQKFYDRNLANISQQADAEGRYSWYGDETGYDMKDPKATRRINLTELATRDTAPADVDPGKGANPAIDRDNYWLYNGQAGNSSWYDEQVRNRQNKSLYARTV